MLVDLFSFGVESVVECGRLIPRDDVVCIIAVTTGTVVTLWNVSIRDVYLK